MTAQAEDRRAAAARGHTSRVGLVAWLLVLSPGAALAQAWSWQSGAQLKAESNSNPALSAEGGAAAYTGTGSVTAAATRSTEITESRADGELLLTPADRNGTAEANALGRLTWRHRLTLPRERWVGGLEFRRDRTLDGTAIAADLAVGRTDRQVGAGSLSWTNDLDERLAAELQASHSRTRYGARVAGTGYTLGTARAGLRYAWQETLSLSLDASRIEQRLDSPALDSTIDGLRLGLERSATELTSFSLSLARSATTQRFVVRNPVCPLPVAYCLGGVVPFVLAEVPVENRRHDLQYSAQGQHRLDERTTFVAQLSRSLTPGALGVSRDDALAIGATHAWSEATSASVNLDWSRSRPAGGDAAAASLRALSLLARHRWDEQWTLQSQWVQRQVWRGTPQSRASSSAFSISLQYAGVTVPGWR